MRFFCSLNSEVKKYLGASGKLPNGGNFKAFNENWTPVESSIKEITAAVCSSSGLCAWHLIDGRRSKNDTGAIKAGLIIIDVDNQDDKKDSDGEKVQRQELTPTESITLGLSKKYLSLGYYSPSSTAT